MTTRTTPETTTSRRRPKLTDPEVRELWPALTRFYGLSFEDLRTLPRVALEAYVDAMPTIIAREQLLAVEVSAFPHLKKSDARQLLSQLQRRAQLEDKLTPPAVASVEALAAIGIAVEGVPVRPVDGGVPDIWDDEDGAVND